MPTSSSKHGNLLYRIQGCLIGGALGDAMGRSVEGERPPKKEWVQTYKKWHGWRSGPIGTITDDTQLTMWLAESLIDNSGVNPEDLADRFSREYIRGIGKATREFLHKYKVQKLPLAECGIDSAGNGAAMRAAPIGIFFERKPAELINAAAAQAAITHRNSMAIASSIIVAMIIALLMDEGPGDLLSLRARIDFCSKLAGYIKGVEDKDRFTTRDRNVREDNLYNRISNAIPELLAKDASPMEVNELFWSGAYVLESLPFALYCFLRTPSDFSRTLFDAVNYSKDSDTVAAMACSMSGALNGIQAIDTHFIEELEFKERLTAIADRLAQLHEDRNTN